MERGDKIVKLLTVFLYGGAALYGIIVGGVTGLIQRPIVILSALAVTACVTVMLGRLKVETEKQIKTYVFVAMIAMTVLSFFDAYALKMPYLFVICQMLFLLCNIPGLRRYVFVTLTEINIVVISIMTFGFHMFDFLEYQSMVILLIFSCWVATIYTKRVAVMMRRIEEQNQSQEDMLALIEAKFNEEKGANTAKSAFLANMSHEIRTPINAILGMNTMILRESGEEQTIEKAKEIENASQTLLALINDILDISKVESGKMEIVPVDYDFSSLINDVVNMISFKAKAKNLELKLAVLPTLPSRINGDDVRIRQILINLLSNAVKYTERGTVTLSIDGETNGETVMLKFSVSDTGIGIRQEDMEKLFSKYERLDVVKNRNVEGTGLGMAITQRLLALMNSKLNVTSVYGKGSDFSFYLEQKVVDAAPLGDISQKHANSQVEKESTQRFIAPDARILVVDDNAVNRKIFKGLLKRIKPHIDEADSGKEALRLVEERKYDLIFLDHMMPEMDGIETRRRMKDISLSPNIGTPIIALTANAISGSKEYYLSEGFDGYLSKPIMPDELEKTIYTMLPKNLIEKFFR